MSWDSNQKSFYSQLYARRETSSTEEDIRDFMGHTGYGMFKDSVNIRVPKTLESINGDLRATEVLAALKKGSTERHQARTASPESSTKYSLMNYYHSLCNTWSSRKKEESCQSTKG